MIAYLQKRGRANRFKREERPAAAGGSNRRAVRPDGLFAAGRRTATRRTPLRLQGERAFG